MTDTLDRTETQTPLRDPLYINDAELIRRMGIPEKKARRLILYWDSNPKLLFPQKDKLCDGRRYWPAVKAFFDRRNRLNMEASPKQRGVFPNV
jgi:hypothetical protein